MKRFCLSLAALLTAIALAAAPANAGKKDDTLVWATDRDNPVADPFYLNTRELVVIGHHVWDTLVIIDPNTAEIKPLLATKWTWANPTTLEMELRKGVKFHSGKVMDADDVVYTLNHVSNKDNAIANFALLAWIKSAEKIDADKIRINLNRPFPPALAYLAGLGFIMQKGHYDGAPVKPDGKKDFGAVKPNGTGPYKITEVKPGEHILMEKNAGYFKDGFKGDPKIGKIRFRTIKDTNTRTAELMTGAIDWIWDVPKDQAERIKANPAITVENAKTLRVSYLQFDVQGVSGQKFFADKRVRQAVAHAIDREAITKNLVGPASEVAPSPCHPDQFACSGDVPKYAYDPAKAKALLKEAGYRRRFRVRPLRLSRPRVHGSPDRRSGQGRPQAEAQLRAVHRLRRGRAQGPAPGGARHLGLQLGAGRVGHGRAFLPARAGRPHQGPGGQEADRGGRFPHRPRQAQGGLAEGAGAHRRGGLLGAALHLRQVLRLRQGPRLQADLRRDPAVLRREVEVIEGPLPACAARVPLPLTGRG